MKIIIRMPNWVGDLVMATPVLVDLRKTFPDAQITALCQAPSAELLQKDQSINELFSFSRSKSKFLRRVARRNIISKLRIGKYDLGILLTGSFSSAWLFWQGRVAQRVGFAKGFRSLLLTDAISESKKSIHQVLRYKQLLKPLGIEESATMPRLCVSEREVEESRELLFQRGYKRGHRLIGINPGAAYGTAKCWLPERFSELALKLVQEDPMAYVLFFGDSSSIELIKKICVGLHDRVINLAGVTSLRELACLIKDCSLLITNDSGPMHIGAAFDVPLVALFGSTDDVATGPYGCEDAVLNKRVSCSPCFKRTCPIDFRCMKEITVEDVLHLVRRRKKNV